MILICSTRHAMAWNVSIGKGVTTFTRVARLGGFRLHDFLWSCGWVDFLLNKTTRLQEICNAFLKKRVFEKYKRVLNKNQTTVKWRPHFVCQPPRTVALGMQLFFVVMGAIVGFRAFFSRVTTCSTMPTATGCSRRRSGWRTSE